MYHFKRVFQHGRKCINKWGILKMGTTLKSIPIWKKSPPGVDWSAVADSSNCSHHGRVETVGHAE